MKKIALIAIAALAVSGCMTHKKPKPGKVIIPQNVKPSIVDKNKVQPNLPYSKMDKAKQVAQSIQN